jgi:hypothetical protein
MQQRACAWLRAQTVPAGLPRRRTVEFTGVRPGGRLQAKRPCHRCWARALRWHRFASRWGTQQVDEVRR